MKDQILAILDKHGDWITLRHIQTQLRESNQDEDISYNLVYRNLSALRKMRLVEYRGCGENIAQYSGNIGQYKLITKEGVTTSQ